MIVLSALVFAFTISTESNRNFMRAPEWVPEVIGEECTFGTHEHMANEYALRLTDSYIGAITAIYDAFYERAYFGSVGPSNNWQEAADDYTGINVFKVGRNFDFFYKCLVYTNDDGTVVGDTNSTGLVLTDSRRLVEYDNLRTFFTRAYNNFLDNGGRPLLGRSTWETDNRMQYWSCSRMPNGGGRIVPNAFVTSQWWHGSRGYGGPSQLETFIPLSAMSHQGALWSDGEQVEHIVRSLLLGSWTGDEIVYGEDDLGQILRESGSPEEGFIGKPPSVLFDGIYHSGTNGISGEDCPRRLLPDIYTNIVGNYYEPGKYSYKTNEMWSVPAALTLAASTLDTTIEQLKLIENENCREVLNTVISWESTNIYQPGIEHLVMPVTFRKVIDESGQTKIVGTVNTECPMPNRVIDYNTTISVKTNNVILPKNYGTYRFSGMLPGNPINPRINLLDMAAGIQTNKFDFLEQLKVIYAPELAGLEKTEMNIHWIYNPGSYVECIVTFPDADPLVGEQMVWAEEYSRLWVEDQSAHIPYDAYIDLKGSYSFSRSYSTARAESYHFATAPHADRLESTTFHMAAAELMELPDRDYFVNNPYTITTISPSPLYFDILDTTKEFYREYYFDGNYKSVGNAVFIVNDRVRSNVIGDTLTWTPGVHRTMQPDDMLEGTLRIEGSMPIEDHMTFRPDYESTYFVTFDENGLVKYVYDSNEDGAMPVKEIEGIVYFIWVAYDTDHINVTADTSRLDIRNIRPPVAIDDRFGLLMKNTWKWRACQIKE